MQSLFRYMVLFLILLPSWLNGQRKFSPEEIHAEEPIVWLGQYPDAAGTKKSGAARLGRLVLGARDKTIVKPVGCITDNEGALWILSQGNGSLVYREKGDSRSEERLMNRNDIYPSLISLCRLPGKGILFTDSFLNGVYLYSEKNRSISKFIQSTSLDQPTGIAWSPRTNETWVCETGSHRISVFNSEGELLSSFGERGSGPGEFNFPTHICIDPAGTAYIVDAMNFRVQIFDYSGTYVNSFGQQGDVSGTIARPKGIAVDSEGNIYVVDALFSTVQIFSSKGDFLYYFGKQGTEQGAFWMPTGIYIDKEDIIYVSDSYNNRVQLFMKNPDYRHE